MLTILMLQRQHNFEADYVQRYVCINASTEVLVLGMLSNSDCYGPDTLTYIST